MRIAVVGSGISGLGAAWALNQQHEVTLYESESRVGGHARTIDVDMGRFTHPVDTGFIVYNEHNYPNLTNLFANLGTETIDSDMSFSVSDRTAGIEYAGSIGGILANRTNVLRPRMWSILRGINQFRGEQELLYSGKVPEGLSISDYLLHRQYPDAFASHYLLPLAAAVWSGTGDDVAKMPAQTFLRFLANHGLLRLSDRPQWRTVAGGSREYVEQAVAGIDNVLVGHPVRAIERRSDGVTVVAANGHRREFDEVVLATHADTALAILGEDATYEERAVIGGFRYSENRAVVHSDSRLMPASRRAWASWNAIGSVAADASTPVSVTYWMNRLQSLPETRQVFVSLNPTIEPRPDLIIDDVLFQHPQFDAKSTRAQQKLGLVQGRNRTWFAGAYCGYGFHEDGLQAGLTVAAQLGSPAPWVDRITPMSPAAQTAIGRRIRVAA